KGKGGSMHIADFAVGMLGANGVVAAGLTIAVGAAHAAKLLGQDKVVVCFFGDGAVNRGPFLEALNWARIYDLPVLFVCEDNLYASTTRTASTTGGPGVIERAKSLGLAAHGVDGNDVIAVDDIAGELIRGLRQGSGPVFLHARTYRLKGHTASDPAPYRPVGEAEARWQDDPIARLGAFLGEQGIAAADLARFDAEARAVIDRAVAAAEEAPFPAPREAYTDIQDLGAPSWT
ncbi:MAG: thiamine pyrophosphate-dependent dehydrogenase E1 component subunit alpha, partial [Alphaproteobacteria bacterium]|nr:thiamine pyrophosphate-dependent dehydrogenase E1 component subunit alpha [Alphaproteobacteria bacterium]